MGILKWKMQILVLIINLQHNNLSTNTIELLISVILYFINLFAYLSKKKNLFARHTLRQDSMIQVKIIWDLELLEFTLVASTFLFDRAWKKKNINEYISKPVFGKLAKMSISWT